MKFVIFPLSYCNLAQFRAGEWKKQKPKTHAHTKELTLVQDTGFFKTHNSV